MDKFLKIYKLPKLTQEKIKNLNRYIIKSSISNSKTSHKEKPRIRWFHR